MLSVSLPYSHPAISNPSLISSKLNSNKIGLVLTLVMGFAILAMSDHSSSIAWPNAQINWTDAIESTLAKNISYDNTTLLLIGVWVSLIILGGYLLTHIHFKVLKEERR